MKFITTLLLMLAACINESAQFTDNFNDGDFTNNPTWVGSSSDFVVNASGQLQSNNTIANATFFISTANNQATVAQWEFNCTLAFNPSSANYMDVFLTASAADFSLNTTTGYFVRLGGTDDEICLFRKDAGGAVTKIIDGVNGVLNSSNNTLRIKVTRNAANLFTLWRDVSGTGNNYFSEGTITDNTWLSSAFFGILIKQSTASFFQRHYFDDIIVQTYVPDITPPAILSATAINTNSLDVLFNEPVEINTAQLFSNYSVNGIGMPTSVVRDPSNAALVHLVFGGNFSANTLHTLTVANVQDFSGNAMSSSTIIFVYYVAQRFHIVMDEIMADPTPLVGLPDAEWVELKNTTSFSINLSGWRIGKPSGLSGAMPSYVLKPDSFVVITSASNIAAMNGFGAAIGVSSFPSLTNTGDVLLLKAPNGLTVHTVQYSDNWYGNDLKKDGGWSLEMIDTKNPCNESNNWKASTDNRGGTPARKNAVDANNPDQTNPKLLRAYATDSATIILAFSEPLDSAASIANAQYSISDGIGAPQSVIVLAPLFNRVQLNLINNYLQSNKIYTVSVTGVKDCSGNTIAPASTARVALASRADSLDVVVNEILFNPISGGEDYVELYNRSNKTVDLSKLYLANRSSTNSIASITQLYIEPYLFFPDEYVVFTKNRDFVQSNYLVKNPDKLIQLSALPSYNDDKGNVILLNDVGSVADEVPYSEKWHFALINNTEGVALERIDASGSSANQLNWHSAASTAGYGTPTYKNSQSTLSGEPKGDVSISPEIISPDNDGRDDFLTISYQFPEPGSVANITIFDASGRPVRYLVRNGINGTQGYYRWDGLGEQNKLLPTGKYIVLTEIFNLQGKTKRFKQVVVLIRK